MTAAISNLAVAQAPTFAGNAQHTGLYGTTAAVNLNKVQYTTQTDLNNTGAFAHYGMPLVTANNVVIVPVKTASDGFQIQAVGGSNFTLTTDYVLPPHNWIPVYQPVLSHGPSNQTRLYYAGAGGTINYVDNPDATPSAPTQVIFYTDSTTYAANKAAFDSSVFIDTPITADSNGNIFFGFRVVGTAPAPLNTTQSGYARIDANGNGSYVLVGDATNDPQISKDCHNTAPALSNDEQTLYVVAKWSTNAYYGYLVGLDANTLATKFKVFLWDPRKNGNAAGILDDGTSSPMVAPDGDVYLGTFGNPYNGSRGFLQHFSSDLAVEKTPGGFGWDYTPAIVPASMVPSYTGTSSYLLFCKYNNYNLNDGNGINTLAILDPNATQLDGHPSAAGMVEMREVLKVIGPTPDAEYPSTPGAVREWCINAAVVNPPTNSIFFDSEDGHIYRWNTSLNCISQAVVLTNGIGAPYIPTTMGPDGRIYTMNGGQMFRIGEADAGASLSISSSSPDMRDNVSGDSITFTVNVSAPLAPVGTVTFTDTTYDGLTPVSTVLASDVPVDANGNASVTTAALTAGNTFLGNHFITASFTGLPASGEVTMVQKVHANASSTTVAGPGSVAFGSPAAFTATVASSGPIPTGYVTFKNGATILGQVPLDVNGQATLQTSALTGGVQTVTAYYNADTYCASSSGSAAVTVTSTTTTSLAAQPGSSTYGQAIVFTATVVGQSGTPSGTVTFSDGATSLGSASVDQNGNASITVTSLTAGLHSIASSFTGSNGYADSAASANVTVTDGTSATLTSSLNPSSSGQSVTFTASISAQDAGAGTPSGTAQFSVDGTPTSSSAVDGSGQATFTTSSLTPGTHTVSVAFTGDTGWTGSSANVSQMVKKPTSTALGSSLNPSVTGQSVTLTASVTSVSGTPVGTVTFADGATTLATVAVDGSGFATFTTSTLSIGTHAISASFAGASGWEDSSGNLTQTVTADTTAPSVPTGVTATSGPTKGQVTLSWSASTDPDDSVAYYEIWRSTKLASGYSLITTVSGTSYVDNPGKSQTRYYYIVAVDSHGNKSAASAKVTGKGL